ncbi:MAG: hypothetical protein HY298_04400 [Verrucomicrobia bacterium]|nr:hypothetical protein [Verrucomicrobiota bacterium]
MKHFVVIVCVWFLLPDARGQAYYLDPVTARSTTGQFIVYGPRHGKALPPSLSNATNLVRLEPPILAISCERIKKALANELGAANSWRGKIYVVLRPVRSVDDGIAINASQFTDGWMYQVELPDAVESSRLLRAMVRVVLLEMANRNAGARQAEIPLWLAEGLSQELMAESAIDLVVPFPQQTINGLAISQTLRNARRTDPLTAAHERLCSSPALTFEQLSWPTADQLSSQAGEVYRSSAQLFVHELLELNNGRACMRTMVEQLPHDFNWQTTFLRAFRSRFKSPLDVEKWWALQLVHFTGRDLTQTWPSEDSWKKLDDILRSSVEVRANTNDLPLHTEVSLQTIIKEWDFLRQNRVLRQKVNELQMLRLRVSQDLIYVADDYRRTLDAYLQKRDKAELAFANRKQKRPDFDPLLQETLNELDLLDAWRAQLRPDKNPVTIAAPTITKAAPPPEVR